MSAGIKSKMDEAVINDELDNLLSHKLHTIGSKGSGVRFSSFNQLIRTSNETKNAEEAGARLTKSHHQIK